MVRLSRDPEHAKALRALHRAKGMFLLDLSSLGCVEINLALDLGATVQDCWDILGKDIIFEIDPALYDAMEERLT